MKAKRMAIDRLDLALPGVDRATAEAALRLLGPALQGSLLAQPARHGPVSPAQALADRIASGLHGRLAAHLDGPSSGEGA